MYRINAKNERIKIKTTYVDNQALVALNEEPYHFQVHELGPVYRQSGWQQSKPMTFNRSRVRKMALNKKNNNMI
jgi:hypothetical protein